MKNRTLLFLIAITVMPMGSPAFACVKAEMEVVTQSDGRRPVGYVKDSWTVWYNGAKVDGASAMSFADLGGGYGKDNWAVFYRGAKVDGASAMSFQYVGKGYGKDDLKTYFRGNPINGATFNPSHHGGGEGKNIYTKDSGRSGSTVTRLMELRRRRLSIWAVATERTVGRSTIGGGKSTALLPAPL